MSTALNEFKDYLKRKNIPFTVNEEKNQVEAKYADIPSDFTSELMTLENKKNLHIKITADGMTAKEHIWGGPFDELVQFLGTRMVMIRVDLNKRTMEVPFTEGMPPTGQPNRKFSEIWEEAKKIKDFDTLKQVAKTYPNGNYYYLISEI